MASISTAQDKLAPKFAPLDDTIKLECAALARFLALLKQEQTALSQVDKEVLADLTPKKESVVLELAALAAQRNAVLCAENDGNAKQSITDWLASNPNRSQSKATWEETVALATEARELNRLNGLLIQTCMRHNARILDALHSASNSFNLYNADGKTTPPNGGRIKASV
ncbi:MAG: flagellar protein FlgN [Pseudomonadota bacterium]